MQKSQNEFLVSYRDHMGRVLKDMYMWKKKASETENHMRSHGEIGKLTGEVAKFYSLPDLIGTSYSRGCRPVSRNSLSLVGENALSHATTTRFALAGCSESLHCSVPLPHCPAARSTWQRPQ